MFDSLLEKPTDAATRLAATALSIGEDCWRWKPAPTRWSPAEIIEHVVLVNRLGARRLATLAVINDEPAVTDEEIPYLFYQADEPTGLADPTGQFPIGRGAVDALTKAALDLTIAVDRSADLRRLGAIHPLFGLLDGAQWVMFYAAHMDRHRAELIGLDRDHRSARGRAG